MSIAMGKLGSGWKIRRSMMMSVLAVCVPVVCVSVACISVAHGQVGPQGGGPGGQGGGPGGGNNRQTVTLPEVDLKPVEAARKELAEGRAQLARAERALASVKRRLEAEIDSRPDVAAAIAAVTQAKAELDREMAPVLAELATHGDYKLAEADLAAAKLKLEGTGKETDSAGGDQAEAMKAVTLARETLSRLKADALSPSASVSEARKKYADSGAALGTLRRQYAQFESNSDFATARNDVEDARTKLHVAENSLAAARSTLEDQKKAREEALKAARSASNSKSNSGNGPGGGGGGGGGIPPG